MNQFPLPLSLSSSSSSHSLHFLLFPFALVLVLLLQASTTSSQPLTLEEFGPDSAAVAAEDDFPWNKRAGFVGMRGKKSDDDNELLGAGQDAADEYEVLSRYPFDAEKRGQTKGFLGMRGKKSHDVNEADLEHLAAALEKRAGFVGMRGKKAGFVGMRGRKRAGNYMYPTGNYGGGGSSYATWLSNLRKMTRRGGNSGFVGMRG